MPCHVPPRLRRVILTQILFIGLLLVPPAQARVVGLVLDDSGSMIPIFERAQFAAQLLVAVLNPDDRLYLVRLNGDQGRIAGPLDLSDRSTLMEQIRDQWQSVNNDPTPYPPLETLLDQLVAATRPGEEASLLVITDGEFSFPPDHDELDAHYQRLKNAFQGKNLAVRFVVLHHNKDLRAVIEQQGIRQALLTTFNGSPDAGRVDIDRAQNVFPGLRRVITELYGTDPDGLGDVAEIQGRDIRLHPPFSIRRLVVALADEQGRAPARFEQADFPLNPDPPLAFLPATAHDRAAVYHLQPSQPLLPGQDYRLRFNQNLPPDTSVLFDSGLDLQLSYFVNGQPVTANAQGRLVIDKGVPLDAHATLTDSLNAQAPQVDFSALPREPDFTLFEGQRRQPMRLDKPGNFASAQVAYSQPGQYTLTVQARYPGFIVRRAQDVIIEVREIHNVKLSWRTERRDGCEECAADETRALFTTQAGYRDLLGLTLTAEGLPETASFALTLAAPLPTGVRLLAADGQTVLNDAATQPVMLKLAPGQSLPLRLQYNRDYRDVASQPITLTVRPQRTDLRGTAALPLKLIPKAPALHFEDDGHTGGDQTHPLHLPLTQLGGEAGVFEIAKDALTDLNPEYLTVDSPTLNLALRVEGPHRVRVMPKPSWHCDCLTPPGEHRFTLRYDDPTGVQPAATYTGHFWLVDEPWVKKCWQEALIVLTVLLALLKIVCHLRTVRFPAGSQVQVWAADRNGPPRRFYLHSGWSTVLSCRDERRRAYILDLRALPTGASIVFSRNYPETLCFQDRGDGLMECFANRQQRDAPWRWGEVLIDEETQERFVLLKDGAQYRPDDD